MSITRLPNIDDVASIIELTLNAISAAMFAASDITSEVVYKITADVMSYDEMCTKEDSSLNNVRYTPGLLSSLGNFDMTQDLNYTAIFETFSLDIYGYDLQMEDHKKILDEYIFQRSHTGDITQSNDLIFDYIGYKTNYTLTKPIIAGHINSEDGSGVDRFLSTNAFYFDFQDGGVAYNDTSLTIDGIQIPYSSYSVNPTNSIVSNIWLNEDLTKNVAIGSSFSIQIEVPVLSSNTKIVSLLAEAKALTTNPTSNLNTTHTIVFNDSITTETYTTILSNSPYSIQYGGTELFTLNFVPYKEGIL